MNAETVMYVVLNLFAGLLAFVLLVTVLGFFFMGLGVLFTSTNFPLWAPFVLAALPATGFTLALIDRD